MKAQLPAPAPPAPLEGPRRHQPIRRHRQDGRPHRERALTAPPATTPLRPIAAQEHAPSAPWDLPFLQVAVVDQDRIILQRGSDTYLAAARPEGAGQGLTLSVPVGEQSSGTRDGAEVLPLWARAVSRRRAKIPKPWVVGGPTRGATEPHDQHRVASARPPWKARSASKARRRSISRLPRPGGGGPRIAATSGSRH